MSLLRSMASGLRSLFRKEQVSQELDEELSGFLEMAAEEKMKQGMSRKDALRAVRLEEGTVEVAKEVVRSAGWEFFLETYWQDLRFAARMLRKNPGFTAVAVLTLALGIGANTAMFSVMQGVVLAPLQYVNPDRLVVVWENNPRFPRTWVSYPNFRDWQRSARSFQPMAAFRQEGVDFAGPGTPEHLNGKEISSGLFSTLGTELALGREFSPEEDRFGGNPVAIITNRLWRNRFEGSPKALGKSLTLDGVNYTIVGVTPFGVTALGFRLEDDADVY